MAGAIVAASRHDAEAEALPNVAQLLRAPPPLSGTRAVARKTEGHF